MNNLPTVKDVLTYLKDNKKSFFGATIIAIAMFGMFFAISTKKGQSTDVSKEEFHYQFEFIVENKEGNLSNNPQTVKYVLDRYIVDKQIKVGGVTSTKLTESYDITYNNQVGVMTLKSTGELAVSQALYDILAHSDSTYFKDRSVFLLMSGPEEFESETSLIQSDKSFSPKQLLIYVVGTIVTSILLGFLLSWGKETKSKTIRNQFYLSSDIPVMNFEKVYMQNSDKLKQLMSLVMNEAGERQTLVITTDDEVKQVLKANQLIDISDGLLTEVPSILNYQEIVLVCRKNNTSKVWYNTQLEILKNLSVPVKCIYF